MTSKEWENKINETLKQKVEEAMLAFQTQREPDIETLARLSEELETFQQKKEEAEEIQKKEMANSMPNSSIVAKSATQALEAEQKMRKVQKNLDSIFTKLTHFEKFNESIRVIYILKLLEQRK